MEMIEPKKKYRTVQARIRPNKDDDLEAALDMLPSHIDESDLVRDALRLLLLNRKSHYYEKLEFEKKIGITESNEYDEPIVLKKVDVTDEDIEKNIDNFITKSMT